MGQIEMAKRVAFANFKVSMIMSLTSHFNGLTNTRLERDRLFLIAHNNHSV